MSDHVPAVVTPCCGLDERFPRHGRLPCGLDQRLVGSDAMKSSYIRTLAATLTGAGLTVALAQTPPAVTPMTPDVMDSYEQVLPSADFIRREAMIPMRDGVKLYTVVVMKKGTTNAPILFSRTPYDAHESTHRVASQRLVDILEVMDAEFVEDGYIRVY